MMIVRYTLNTVIISKRNLDSHSGDERKCESIIILFIVIACLMDYNSGGDSITIEIMVILVEQYIFCNSNNVINMVIIS